MEVGFKHMTQAEHSIGSFLHSLSAYESEEERSVHVCHMIHIEEFDRLGVSAP